MTSLVLTVITAIQAKHKSEMVSLREMIKKSLLLRKFSSTISSPNPDANPKVLLQADTSFKNERWNQAQLGSFNPHLDKAHGKNE